MTFHSTRKLTDFQIGLHSIKLVEIAGIERPHEICWFCKRRTGLLVPMSSFSSIGGLDVGYSALLCLSLPRKPHRSQIWGSESACRNCSESRESCHLACPPSAPGSLRALTLLVSQRASGIDVPRIVLAMQHRSLFLKPTESEYPFYQQTRYFVGTSAL